MVTTWDVSDIVTLDYWNKTLWGDPSVGLHAPRWIRIQIVSREANKGLASVAEDLWISPDLLNVRFGRCACGIEFAFADRIGYLPPKCCKSCDQRQRAASQRNRRMRQRASELAQVCAHCGGKLAAQRRTRKYCCSACRVAALRESRPRQAT